MRFSESSNLCSLILGSTAAIIARLKFVHKAMLLIHECYGHMNLAGDFKSR